MLANIMQRYPLNILKMSQLSYLITKKYYNGITS